VISGLYKQILNKGDQDEIIQKAKALSDRLDYIDHPVAKKIRDNIMFDLTHPNMWKFTDPYHVEWIKEWVAEQIEKTKA
jgi:hypothetical protein